MKIKVFTFQKTKNLSNPNTDPNVPKAWNSALARQGTSAYHSLHPFLLLTSAHPPSHCRPAPVASLLRDPVKNSHCAQLPQLCPHSPQSSQPIPGPEELKKRGEMAVWREKALLAGDHNACHLPARRRDVHHIPETSHCHSFLSMVASIPALGHDSKALEAPLRACRVSLHPFPSMLTLHK